MWNRSAYRSACGAPVDPYADALSAQLARGEVLAEQVAGWLLVGWAVAVCLSVGLG